MAKHTKEELIQWQALPLEVKVQMTCYRIREWVREYGEDGVYVSFSGGKDSTVLLHLVREVCGFKNVPAVFVNTGLEYPEVVQHVKTFENVTIVRPQMNFRQVIEKYGYPFFSKEISRFISGAKRWKDKYLPNDSFVDTDFSLEQIKTMNCDAKIMCGKLEHKENGVVVEGEYSQTYNKKKFRFAVDAPEHIRFSNRCCGVMKKKPIRNYAKKTHRNAITAQMASESKLREKNWLKYGCNGFEFEYPISNPMAFWTEQDVLLYIKLNNIKIPSVYGEVVVDYDAIGQLDGQMDMSDLSAEFGLFDLGNRPLKTTGCDRTGCMFCGYGCHLEKEGQGRFERMKETHPKLYDYIMRPWEQEVEVTDPISGEKKMVKQLGLNYKEVIDWINEHGNLDIKY